MKTILRILVLVLSVVSLQGCQNETYAEPTEECVSPSLVKNKEVSDIFTATPSGSTNQYLADDIIEAVVTSSDEGGNFFKSISLMSLDGTRGFSISIDEYNLYTKKLQPGRKVYVKMKNLYTSNPTGGARGLNFGGAPSGTFNTLERLSALEYSKFVVPTCASIDEDSYVKNLTLAQLSNDLYLNTLVEINNVQFESEGTTYGNRPSDLFDKNENITDGTTTPPLPTRTSKFANFAGSPLPSGRGKIRGVLTKFNGGYQLIIRTERDVKLTNPRVDFNPPIVGNAQTFAAALNEPFTSYAINQSNFPKYINDAFVNSRYWQVKSFSGNQYIEMTSFGGGGVTARTFFYVPVDFTAANNFGFKRQMRFFRAPALNVYYVSSANYTPGSVTNTANFTNITSSFNIPVLANGASDSGFLPVTTYSIPPALTGTGYFVFEYFGTPTETTTIQIDDIFIN